MPTTKADEIIHEYPAIGKYRVRVLRKEIGTGKEAKIVTSLDVREHISAEKFEGFTRRGIRLTGKADLLKLRDEISDAIERNWFE